MAGDQVRDPVTGEYRPRENPRPEKEDPGFEFTATPEASEVPWERPPDHTATKPKFEAPKSVKNLGRNKASRGAPRKLTASDTDKLEQYYNLFGMGVMPFKPRVSEAIFEEVDGQTRARICAESMCELAQENDSVRRTVLWLVEGGAWAKVFAAHVPIIVAAIPEDVIKAWFPFQSPAEQNGTGDGGQMWENSAA